MITKPKIHIEDYGDGFTIIVYTEDIGKDGKRYYIDQEDNRYSLKKLFETLGFDTTYEEAC